MSVVISECLKNSSPDENAIYCTALQLQKTLVWPPWTSVVWTTDTAYACSVQHSRLPPLAKMAISWPIRGLGHFCLNYSVVCCALSVVTVAGARQCSAAAAASTACLSHSRQISNSKSLVVTCDWGGRGDNRLSCKLQHCVHSCVVLPGAVMLLTDQHSDNCRLNALVSAWRLILRGIQGWSNHSVKWAFMIHTVTYTAWKWQFGWNLKRCLPMKISHCCSVHGCQLFSLISARHFMPNAL